MAILGFYRIKLYQPPRSADMKQADRHTEQAQASERKGINLKLSPDDYARLERAKDKGGFRSVYEIAKLAVVSFLNHVDRAERRKEDDLPKDIGEEIELMFRDYAEAEQPQDVARYKRTPKPSFEP